MRLWLITRLDWGATNPLYALMKREMKKREQRLTAVAKQYIGNLGKTANGIVSVNAYAVVAHITIPLMFKVFKPRSRLKKGDEYKHLTPAGSGNHPRTASIRL